MNENVKALSKVDWNRHTVSLGPTLPGEEPKPWLQLDSDDLTMLALLLNRKVPVVIEGRIEAFTDAPTAMSPALKQLAEWAEGCALWIHNKETKP